MHPVYRFKPDTLKLLSYRINRNLLLVSAQSFETNDTVRGREQCIVTATSDIGSGMNLSAALSVKDISGLNKLTIGSLRAQTFGLGISTVLRRTDTLLMSE